MYPTERTIACDNAVDAVAGEKTNRSKKIGGGVSWAKIQSERTRQRLHTKTLIPPKGDSTCQSKLVRSNPTVAKVWRSAARDPIESIAPEVGHFSTVPENIGTNCTGTG